MRMSCNGCRVLRKGCSENCNIRPCLQWIKNPESQANATVFLAKFYGRAGLMNLINGGPEHLRPAIFRSLLYEACGRIVNPIYGSVGLMWSGSWQLCQAAVEAVLKGAPITPINSEAAANGNGPPLKAYDIRHVSKDENSAASSDPNRVKTRCRVRRVVKPKASKPTGNGFGLVVDSQARDELTRSTSHESSLSHHHSEAAVVDGDSKESDESMVSVETAEASPLFPAEPEPGTPTKRHEGVHSTDTCPDMEGIGLELTLGFERVSPGHYVVPVKKRRVDACGSSDADITCKVGLGLEYPA